MTPRLVVVYGPQAGSTIFLDEMPVTIGRHPSSQINLPDPYVSRQHCILTRSDNEYMIMDLNSSNGTYVSGKRVKESSLGDGCPIQVGQTLFTFWSNKCDELNNTSEGVSSEFFGASFLNHSN